MRRNTGKPIKDLVHTMHLFANGNILCRDLTTMKGSDRVESDRERGKDQVGMGGRVERGVGDGGRNKIKPAVHALLNIS